MENRIILASRSPSRAMILKNAGVPFDAVPADIDETAIIAGNLAAGQAPGNIGALLAEAKAAAVSRLPAARGRTVLAADQILVCDGEIFEKPGDMDEARETLKKLRGKKHSLLACVAIFEGGKKACGLYDEAHLTMRNFSGAYLDRYLAEAGEGILTSVGAYPLEGMGAQLFEKIEGDFFTILGLPLLPVLDFLRGRGAPEG